MRHLKPLCPPLRIDSGSKTFPAGFTAEELTQAGRRPHESFSQYCRRLLRNGTWGGATECYVVSQITKLPVYVTQRGLPPVIYLPENKNELAHRIAVKFNGINHYDAIVDNVPPILQL